MKSAKYHVLGPLMGGYGSRAFLGQEVLGEGRLRSVVMVFLPDEIIQDADFFKAILDETRVAIRIDQANVTAVYGLVKFEEGYARIVDFADAESLRSIFHRAKKVGFKIPPPIAISIMADACMGVHYSHELGTCETGKALLHRGIRPETLLVNFQGVGKVTGFGAATMADLMWRLGAESSLRDPYTAPEQVFGGRKAATVQTDIYGLGAVLYEGLSGHPPVGVDAALIEEVTGTKIPTKRLEGVSDELTQISFKAMSRSSKERYSTALQMRQALLDLGTTAAKQEVAAMMEKLFPPDMPQRKARDELLRRGKQMSDMSSAVFEEPVEGICVTDSEGEIPDLPLAPVAQAAVPREKKSTQPVQAKRQKPPVSEAPSVVTQPVAPPAVVPVQTSRSRQGLLLVLIVLVALLGGGFLGVYFFSKQSQTSEVVPSTLQPKLLSSQENTGPGENGSAQKDPATKTTGPAKPGDIASSDPTPNAPEVSPKKLPRSRKKKVASKPPLELVPQGNTGTLEIDAPANSIVFIDGRRVGVIPMKPIKLSAGKHQVLVKQAGTEAKVQQTVYVKSNMEHTLSVEFY